MTMSDPSHIRRWLLNGADNKDDTDLTDRLADIVLDGLSAIGGPETIGLRLQVLVKVQAMLIAGVRNLDPVNGSDVAERIFATMGGTLKAETDNFHKAFQRDARRAAKTLRLEHGGG